MCVCVGGPINLVSHAQILPSKGRVLLLRRFREQLDYGVVLRANGRSDKT